MVLFLGFWKNDQYHFQNLPFFQNIWQWKWHIYAAVGKPGHLALKMSFFLSFFNLSTYLLKSALRGRVFFAWVFCLRFLLELFAWVFFAWFFWSWFFSECLRWESLKMMTNLFNYSLDSQTLTNCGLVVIDNIASLLTPLLGADGSNFPKISGQISAVKTR